MLVGESPENVSVYLHAAVHFFITLLYYPFVPLAPCFFMDITIYIFEVPWLHVYSIL